MISHKLKFIFIHIPKTSGNSLSLFLKDFIENYPNLFDDSKSITTNFKNFIENRHDASCWSLICKTNGVEEEFDWKSIPIEITRIRK
tara:strand:- start:137 stop:397 length:261 start_codon:yes stop_codon:yes gene_type:complete